jgi:hypothetical protein
MTYEFREVIPKIDRNGDYEISDDYLVAHINIKPKIQVNGYYKIQKGLLVAICKDKNCSLFNERQDVTSIAAWDRTSTFRENLSKYIFLFGVSCKECCLTCEVSGPVNTNNPTV